MLPNAINVWATTSWYDGTSWNAADQMGRPAINTVFNPSADKNLFNMTAPAQQRTASGGKFFNNGVNGLKFFSSLDSEGAYSQAQAEALASVLIPDVLPYSRTSTLPAPLHRRDLRAPPGAAHRPRPRRRRHRRRADRHHRWRPARPVLEPQCDRRRAGRRCRAA